MNIPTSKEAEARKEAADIAAGERRYRDEICGDEFIPLEFAPLDLGMGPEIGD
jgi:hypothetical protein